MQLSNQATNIERVTRNLVVVGSIPTRGSFVLVYVKNNINSKFFITKIFQIITIEKYYINTIL